MARASLQASVPNSGAHSELFERRDFWALTFGTIGVVYGDIGTSPLYAVRESVFAAGGVSSNAEIILGILSLIIWALILVVTVKYVRLLLRADNDGEGGTLALMALAQRASSQVPCQQNEPNCCSAAHHSEARKESAC